MNANATALLALPAARLVRSPRAWLAALAWAMLVLASAAGGRGADAADVVFLGVYGHVALPLLAFGLVSAALGGAGLRVAVSPLVAFGARPAPASLAHASVAIAASAAAGGLLAIGVVLVAHRADASSPFAADLIASTYAGALGGAAYAAYFVLGSAFGARGGGRVALLIVDAVLGAGHAGAGALLVPRPHVRQLLGDASASELSARASGMFLLALAIIYTALAALRARRSPG